MLFTWMMDLQNALILCHTNVYEIMGNLLRWIARFLSNRRQCVVLNGKNLVGKMLRAAFLKDKF